MMKFTFDPGVKPVAEVPPTMTVVLTAAEARLIHALIAPTTGELGYSIYSALDAAAKSHRFFQISKEDLSQHRLGDIRSDDI
jgi:hypothetical protein